MNFLWRHKGLTVLIAAGILYWFTNPSDRIGMARTNLVVHRRMPIAFYDLYVSPEGKRRLIEDLKREKARANLCDTLGALNQRFSHKKLSVLVGVGFGSGEAITFFGEQTCIDQRTLLLVEELPSRDAIARYNRLIHNGDTVALILRIKS